MHDEFCVCLYRQALAPKGAKGAPPPPQEEGPRTILKMTQKFRHNPDVPAERDVAKRVFDIANGHIRSAHTLISAPHPPSPLNTPSLLLSPPPSQLAKMDLLGAKQCSHGRGCMCTSCVSLILHLSYVLVVDAHCYMNSAGIVLTAACISHAKCNSHECVQCVQYKTVRAMAASVLSTYTNVNS